MTTLHLRNNIYHIYIRSSSLNTKTKHSIHVHTEKYNAVMAREKIFIIKIVFEGKKFQQTFLFIAQCNHERNGSEIVLNLYSVHKSF